MAEPSHLAALYHRALKAGCPDAPHRLHYTQINDDPPGWFMLIGPTMTRVPEDVAEAILDQHFRGYLRREFDNLSFFDYCDGLCSVTVSVDSKVFGSAHKHVADAPTLAEACVIAMERAAPPKEQPCRKQ